MRNQLLLLAAPAAVCRDHSGRECAVQLRWIDIIYRWIFARGVLGRSWIAVSFFVLLTMWRWLHGGIVAVDATGHITPKTTTWGVAAVATAVSLTWTLFHIVLPAMANEAIAKNLQKGRCPQCLYALSPTRSSNTGMLLCSECGAMWKERGDPPIPLDSKH